MEHKPLVICIDDDPEILSLLGDVLSMFGFAFLGLRHTSLITKTAAVPTVLFRNCPDILIIDLMLAGAEDGIELAERLRKSGLDCPTIALSASDHMLAIAHDSHLFAACLPKPVDIFILRSTINSLIPSDDTRRGHDLSLSQKWVRVAKPLRDRS